MVPGFLWFCLVFLSFRELFGNEGAIPSDSQIHSQKHVNFLTFLTKCNHWLKAIFSLFFRCAEDMQRGSMLFLLLALRSYLVCFVWCLSKRQRRVIIGQRWQYVTTLQNSFLHTRSSPSSLCGSCPILNWSCLSDSKVLTSSTFKG